MFDMKGQIRLFNILLQLIIYSNLSTVDLRLDLQDSILDEY